MAPSPIVTRSSAGRYPAASARTTCGPGATAIGPSGVVPAASPSTKTAAPGGSLSTESRPAAGAGVAPAVGEGAFASPLAATSAWIRFLSA